MKRATVIAMLRLTAGCASTAANEIGPSYGGGVIENKGYQGVIEPGATNKFVGIMDPNYNYRIDQRSWIARDCANPAAPTAPPSSSCPRTASE